jgi:hypothetical protein
MVGTETHRSSGNLTQKNIKRKRRRRHEQPSNACIPPIISLPV